MGWDSGTVSAQDIITQAYRKVKISSPDASASADGLIDLQMMLNTLSADNFMLPHTNAYSHALDTVNASYAVTLWTTTDPIDVIGAYIRDSSGDDTVLNVTTTSKEYDEIADKDLSGKPAMLYYDPAGTIYLDRVPDEAYTLYLRCEMALTNFTDLNATASFPGYMKEMLVYNLALRLAVDNEIELSEEFKALVTETRTIVAGLQMRDQATYRANIDSALLVRGI